MSEVVEEAETQANLPDNTEQPTESQIGEDVGNSTATVKVVLVPEGHVMTVAFAIGLSIQELKHHLASELRVPPEVLRISLDGQEVEEQQSLMELGVRPHGSTRMEMGSIDPNIHPLRPVRPPEHDNMPDVITVRVQKGAESPTASSNDFQEVVVEIERPPQRKPFLGGFRHRLTGVVYHHASTQTLPRRRPDRGVVVFSRETQTVKMKSQAQQCPVDTSTQTSVIGCYVSCVNDKLLSPGGYTTAAECHDRRLKAVIRLQAAARCWLAKQAVGRLRRDRDRRLAWLDMQDQRRRMEKEEQLRDRRQRWNNPRKREDFNLLYCALEKWRMEEEQHINATLKGAERKAALCSLFDQELEHIKNIEQKRIAFDKTNYDSIRNFLDKSAAPHRWKTAKGEWLEMDTVHTIRARELRDVYNAISESPVNESKRLQILMTLKHTVKEHNCQLTRNIVDLIDREVDLMNCRVKASNLVGHRQRINTLFLQYIKTPTFNPEVAKLLKVPQGVSQLKNNMLLCRSCHRYLLKTSFCLSTSDSTRGRCKDCAELDNIARDRDEFSCYKNILKRLRCDEQQLNRNAKIPFLMEVEDVRYLIKMIWSSQSALSSCADLYNLVFVRWDRLQDWSPWNCVLLSKEEAPVHLQLQEVHKMYTEVFIRSIKLRHIRARMHFSQIPALVEHMDSQLNTTLGPSP